MMFSNLKYFVFSLLVALAVTASAQQVVMKYDADLLVQKKPMSGILIHSVTDSSNRFIFVSKLGLKFFDVEVGKTNYSYSIHYFSPAFKTEKRVIGIAKELFVLGFDNNKAKEKNSKVKLTTSKQGSCKSAFGLFGKRVKVCCLDDHTTVTCKFYPVSFDLRVLK